MERCYTERNKHVYKDHSSMRTHLQYFFTYHNILILEKKVTFIMNVPLREVSEDGEQVSQHVFFASCLFRCLGCGLICLENN